MANTVLEHCDGLRGSTLKAGSPKYWQASQVVFTLGGGDR